VTKEKLMAKVVWAGVEREVKCSDAELAEIMAMDDAIALGVWLAAVEEVGHVAAMMIANDYVEDIEEWMNE